MRERIALVDLGSTAVRFTVAHVIPGRSFRVVQETRAQTRLAAGVRGVLAPPAVRATVVATRRFLQQVDDGRPLRVLAIATSAVRDARNAWRLIDALREATGLEVEVLGWEEEARLGAIAALASLPLREALVADLGGGSLQLTLVRDGEVTPLAGLPLGAVRMTRGLFRHDPPTALEVAALRREVADLVRPHLMALPGTERLVVLGGSARTLARVHLAAARRRRSGTHGYVLGRGDLAVLSERLRAMSLPRRRRVPGLKPRRADIIVAGAVVLEELMRAGGSRTLTVCERGVRHGLLIRETFDLDKRAPDWRPTT